MAHGFTGTKWLSRGKDMLRAPEADIQKYLSDGWVLGRVALGTIGYAAKPKAVGDNSRGGASRKKSIIAKLKKRGLSEEEIRQAWDSGHTWCTLCAEFRVNAEFKSNSKVCNRLHTRSTNSIWQKAKLQEQEGLCAICLTNDGKTLHRDHDHSCCDVPHLRCSCLRGLLCTACNTRLGWFERFVKALVVPPIFTEESWEFHAMVYLQRYSHSTTPTFSTT